MATLAQVADKIKAKFPRSTAFGFNHRTAEDLKFETQKIYWYVVIQSTGKGASVMEFVWRRKEFRTPRQWANWIRDIGYQIYVDSVLTAINNKHDADWAYVDHLGFSFQPALRRERNTAIRRRKNPDPSSGTKTKSSRRKSKRGSNRRR